jgi:hypothetical protein
MLSGVPQGCTLAHLLLNISINDLYAKIYFSEFLLFANDLKIFCVVTSAEDCKLLQSDTDSVQKWCTENYMEINIFRINIIFLLVNLTVSILNYCVGNLLIVRTDCVKDLGVVLDCKLHFHRHVHYLYSRGLKLLELIRFITYKFSSLHSLKV